MGDLALVSRAAVVPAAAVWAVAGVAPLVVHPGGLRLAQSLFLPARVVRTAWRPNAVATVPARG